MWVANTLSDLGYVLFLGHHGNACPVNKDPSKLCIGDLNGFTHTRVQYCDCNGALSKPRQLLLAGLFPCSHRHPKSALTFPLLDMYDVLTTRARTSAYKYYSALEQLTKPGFSADVDDRYRELMWTYRRFLHLLQLRRSGRGFLLHPDIDVHPGDQAVDCFSCPRPGFNFEWAEVPPEEWAWFRFWISFDGNFRSVRKNKRVDPADICLSDNLAYFPHKQTYREWTETAKTTKQWDKPQCDHHKAGRESSARWVGLDVTGVGAFSCARHTCILPRGMVDFFQGELFIYSVYALGALLWYINKRRGDCIPVGLTYDVMCHWIVNFYTRAKLLPLSISIPQDIDIVGAIGKLHLIGHDRECYIRWSLDHKPYVGRIDGEAPERFWSYINQHSGSTSEQSPAVRTDTMNNIVRHWNEDKGFSMNKSIPVLYKLAKKMLAKQKEAFEALNENLPPADIERWEKEPIEPVQGPDKKWTSPLMDPIFDGGFYDTLKEERKKEAPTARVSGRRPGVARWLSDGIEIEHSVHNYNDEARELGASPTPGRANILNTKRTTLRDRIEAHRKKHEIYMEGAGAPDKPRILAFFEEDTEEECFNLAMPSSYSPNTTESAGLATVAEVERELRRAMCKESLQSVKRLLSTKRATQLNDKPRERGQIANTRANAALKEYDAKIRKAQWRYTNSRAALIQLGLAESDEQFQELKDADLKPLSTYFAEYAKRTGHGYDGVSWIWKSSVAPNTEEWEIIALKTEWFRARERYRRWEEELILLKREMVMTIRSFLKLQELWQWKSVGVGITSGMQSYARGRAKFYAQHAERMLVSCREYLYDATVKLKWCENWLQNNVIDNGRGTKDMSNRTRPDFGVRELCEGLESVLFGPGGYDTFYADNARDFANNITTIRAPSQQSEEAVENTEYGLPVAATISWNSTGMFLNTDFYLQNDVRRFKDDLENHPTETDPFTTETLGSELQEKQENKTAVLGGRANGTDPEKKKQKGRTKPHELSPFAKRIINARASGNPATAPRTPATSPPGSQSDCPITFGVVPFQPPGIPSPTFPLVPVLAGPPPSSEPATTPSSSPSNTPNKWRACIVHREYTPPAAPREGQSGT